MEPGAPTMRSGVVEPCELELQRACSTLTCCTDKPVVQVNSVSLLSSCHTLSAHYLCRKLEVNPDGRDEVIGSDHSRKLLLRGASCSSAWRHPSR